MTPEKEERAARTEALFRGVNERIAESRPRYAIVEKVKPLVRRTVRRLDPRAGEA